ncbi:ramosa 1 enhancer locus 2 [Iris pallida]|uniref:Ramosa 1 enhancer locus 2 n=1 Tax=Iris pallida TaxID=29817 RepID=A0AAX6FVQ5_IRIPA|nr:ramosa 1 enhancer locus 2 [Iris pallida]
MELQVGHIPYQHVLVVENDWGVLKPGELKLPSCYLVSSPEIKRTSGEYLVHNGVCTFAYSGLQEMPYLHPYRMLSTLVMVFSLCWVL